MWRVVDRLIDLVVTVLYGVIIVAMFAQVLFRYALGSPLSWSEEISRYMFIWLCYLGAYIALMRNAHVGVDYLTRHFSAPLVRRLNIAFGLIIIAALAFVAHRGLLLTLDNLRAEWWTIPFLSMALAYAAVPVGAVLMILGFLRILVRLVTGRPVTPAAAGVGEPQGI